MKPFLNMNISERIFPTRRKVFDRICKANGLNLSFEKNKMHLALLQQLFEEREYADYFPFYEKAVILDIGAHAGYFSLFASQNVHPDSRIIAVEPESGNYELLALNCRTISSPHIETLHAAIASSDAEMSLFVGNSINHSLVKDYALNTGTEKVQKVQAISLHSLFRDKKIAQIDFLKMDCEGAEYEILEAATKEDFDLIKTISLEFHDRKDVKFTGRMLREKLTELGFHVVKFNYEKTTMGLNFGKLIATKS